jgi:putative thioredoxin
MQGNYPEAKMVMADFPPSPEYSHMQLLQPLYDGLVRDSVDPLTADEILDATYQNALRLIKMGNLAGAMDGLLDILRQDKHFHADSVRKMLLSLFEILGANHPLTQQYRRELAMVLF